MTYANDEHPLNALLCIIIVSDEGIDTSVNDVHSMNKQPLISSVDDKFITRTNDGKHLMKHR